MGMNPVNSFLSSMNATGQILRGRERDKRDQQVFDMKMDLYNHQLQDDDQLRTVKKKKRSVAQKLVKLNGGTFGGREVAELDPAAGFKIGDVSDAFDQKKQAEAMSYVLPVMDKANQGGELSAKEKQAIWTTGGAMTATGVLAPEYAGIKEQAAVAPLLKQKIVGLSEEAKGKILGKQVSINREDDPETFDLFSKMFPAVTNGSKAFKDGAGHVVEFYIDATGVDKIQDAHIVPILQGINPQTGETYRAPMSVRRSSDADDTLSTKTLGQLYADVDFAGRSANALLASLAGLDDATANKVIADVRSKTKKLQEERRKSIKNGKLADAMSELIGFNKKESAAFGKAVQAGADVKSTAELLIKKQQGPKTKVVWRDNVNINGKPYQVAYDEKTGKQIKAVPQWVKPEKGKGSGGGSGGKGGSSDQQKVFNKQLTEYEKLVEKRTDLRAGINEFGMEVPASDVDAQLQDINALIEQKERYMSRISPELWFQYSGKHVGIDKPQRGDDGGVSGGGATLYSKIPGGDKADNSAQKLVKALEKIPDVEERRKAADVVLASDAPDDVKQRFAYYFKSQQTRVGAGMARDQRTLNYSDQQAKKGSLRGGMSARSEPVAVLQQMSGNIPRDNAVRKGSDAAVSWMLQGLDQIGMATPLGVLSQAGSDVVRLVKDFQSWSQHRYKDPAAAKSPEALAEYAKSMPEEAEKIRKTAEMLAARDK